MIEQVKDTRPTSGAGRLALDPRLAYFARRNGTVQVGLDPEGAYVVTPPSGLGTAQLLAVLRLIDGERSRPQIVWSAAELGLAPSLATRLLDELDHAGLLIARKTADVNPQLVRIIGNGPIADELTSNLRSGGINVDRDSSRNFARRCRTVDVQRWTDDFVVLTDDIVPDPRLVMDLTRAKVPHILVRLRDGLGIVGPLVLPGSTSCLRCVDLTRCDFDAEWPFISAQLLGSVGHADTGTIQATATLASTQLRQLIDPTNRVSPATLGCTLEIDLESAVICRRRWPKHPRCDCVLV